MQMQTAGVPLNDPASAEMEAMNRLFEQQMQSPAYNMIQGPLLQVRAAPRIPAALFRMRAPRPT
eukprot:2682273-Prymnesium_polylepis.1